MSIFRLAKKRIFGTFGSKREISQTKKIQNKNFSLGTHSRNLADNHKKNIAKIQLVSKILQVKTLE